MYHIVTIFAMMYIHNQAFPEFRRSFYLAMHLRNKTDYDE